MVPDSLSEGDDVYVEAGCGNELSSIINEEDGSEEEVDLLNGINVMLFF